MHRLLSIVLIVTGLVFILLYPIMNLLPETFGWEPHQREYEEMIQGIYFVLGIFAIIAARNIEQHLGLIWFIAASNIVHGTIMLFQALADPAETPNLRRRSGAHRHGLDHRCARAQAPHTWSNV